MRTVRIALQVKVPDGYDRRDGADLAAHVAAGIATHAEKLHYVETADHVEHRLLGAEPATQPEQPDQYSLTGLLMEAIQEEQGEQGAPTEAVLDAVAGVHPRDEAQEQLHALERGGEVYQPTSGKYRVTADRGPDTQP